MELFLEAARHSPRALLIEGEAGAGKTSIWEAALAAAARGGFSTSPLAPPRPRPASPMPHWVTCSGSARMLWRACRHASARHSRSPFCSMTGLAEAPDQQSVALGLLAMFRRLADDGPLVVAIDDVQWLDATSAQVLRFAMRTGRRRADRVPRGMANRGWTRRFRSSWIVRRRVSAWSASLSLRSAWEPCSTWCRRGSASCRRDPRSGGFTTCPAATPSLPSSWHARSAPASSSLEPGERLPARPRRAGGGPARDAVARRAPGACCRRGAGSTHAGARRSGERQRRRRARRGGSGRRRERARRKDPLHPSAPSFGCVRRRRPISPSRAAHPRGRARHRPRGTGQAPRPGGHGSRRGRRGRARRRLRKGRNPAVPHPPPPSSTNWPCG